LDEPLKLHIDHFFIAHLNRFSQEGCPAGILRGGQLGHPQQHLFEPTIPLRQRLLFCGKFFCGSNGFGLLGRRLARRLFFCCGRGIFLLIRRCVLRPCRRTAPKQQPTGQQYHHPSQAVVLHDQSSSW
jgi:hypothetical protein